MQLSKRLLACCQFVKQGDRVADIGCDHGYLGIHLLKNGLAKSVIAADINEGPLQSAIRNANKYGVADNMRFFLSDGAVSMAAKAHLRADRTTLIALSSNDAMSRNLPSIARMLEHKAVYFLPMRQDDPTKKPHSLVAEYSRMREAVTAALKGEQLRPLFM